MSSTPWRSQILPDPIEVALGRHEAAARVLERLQDHGRHGVGSLEQDAVLDLVGCPQRVAARGRAVGVRVGHVAHSRQERLEVVAQRRDARGRERAERGAVVGHLARDDLGAPRVAAQAVVGARQLERGLDGLGAARGEEDAVEVARGQAGHALGQLDHGGVGEAPRLVEAELRGLGRARRAQLGAAVAGVDAEERGEPVEVAVAALVPYVRTLAPHDDRHLAVVERAQAREVHPQVALRPLGQVAGRAGARRLRLELQVQCHGGLPSSVRRRHTRGPSAPTDGRGDLALRRGPDAHELMGPA